MNNIALEEHFITRSADEDGQVIRFSESEDWQCLATDADSVTIVSVPDIHRSGSSQIKVKNVADSVWERAYRWGNLAAAHPTGQYYAYALTVPGKSQGMIRVIRNHCSDRIILKGFKGIVRDLAFAYHEKRILIAAVDEYGYLFVNEVNGADVKLVLQVTPDKDTKIRETHRVVWCPYMPDNVGKSDEPDEFLNEEVDNALLLAVTHDETVEVWHLGIAKGTVTYDKIDYGAMLVVPSTRPVVDVAFSPDSTAVAVASLDGHIRFFLVNTEKKDPTLLHTWIPHKGKELSGVTFLDNLSSPNSDTPLWKFAVTSADHNQEIKVWSCENWECHQTIRFKAPDSTPIMQKMVIDLSASFLLITDINRRVLYVLHIKQTGSGFASRITSVTQLLLSFPVISLAILGASLKPAQHLAVDDDDFNNDNDSNQVSMKLLIVQPKSVHKCTAIFRVSSDCPIVESSSYSQANTSMDTTISEYDAPKTTNNNNQQQQQHIPLLTPDSLLSPAKMNFMAAANSEDSDRVSGSSPVASSIPLPPQTANEMLALSSPRKMPSPTESSLTRLGNGAAHSGGSSPSREVEEILAGEMMDPTDTSNQTVPCGSVLNGALAAFPSSLSPVYRRSSSSPSAPDADTGVTSAGAAAAVESTTAPTSSSVSPETTSQRRADESPEWSHADAPLPIPPNGSLMELFQDVLFKPNEDSDDGSAPVVASSSSSWPTVLPVLPDRSKDVTTTTTTSNNNSNRETELMLHNVHQTMQQLVSMFSAQQAQYEQIQLDIRQLRQDVNRIDSCQSAKPAWIANLESNLSANFDRQHKKLDEVSAASKMQQVVTKLQSTIRSELEAKVHSLEQRNADVIRKELQAVVSSEMIKLEPAVKATTHQLVTQLSTNKNVMDAYTQATTSVAVATSKLFKDSVTQQLLPSFDQSLQKIFVQLHEAFAKGINEFVGSVEGHLERHRRHQEKGASDHLNATLDRMRGMFDQMKESITAEVKAEMRHLVHEIPEQVSSRLIPVVHAELQRALHEQKVFIDTALQASQRSGHNQSRSSTPAITTTPQMVQAQLKQMISQGHLCETFQRVLHMNDLAMVLFVCAKVDAQKLFATTPCVLSQPILICLIQQLSTDLSTQTELKIGYLQEAVLAVNVRDPMIKEHAPNVMTLLSQHLQRQISVHGNGPLSLQLRMLLRAVQSFQAQIA